MTGPFPYPLHFVERGIGRRWGITWGSTEPRVPRVSHRRVALRNQSQCEEEDLNLHSFRNQILSLARLPVPPSSLGWILGTYDFRVPTSTSRGGAVSASGPLRRRLPLARPTALGRRLDGPRRAPATPLGDQRQHEGVDRDPLGGGDLGHGFVQRLGQPQPELSRVVTLRRQIGGRRTRAPRVTTRRRRRAPDRSPRRGAPRSRRRRPGSPGARERRSCRRFRRR